MTTAPRRPIIDPADYDAAQQALHTAILEGPRKPNAAAITDGEGRLIGPFPPMLLSPAIGDRLQGLGPVAQSESSLSPLDRELAILVLSHARGADVEVRAHTAKALTLGLTEAQAAAVVAGEPTHGLNDTTAALLVATRLIVAHETLTDDVFDAVVAAVGRRGLFELIVLLGYYDIIATVFSAFEITA